MNPANRHHVRFKYAHFIVIVVHEYRLYYYEHGVLIRRFDVALGRPGFPTPIGTFHIYGKRKPAGGPEGACAMFYRQAGRHRHPRHRPALADQPAGPSQLLARLRAHAQQAGALAVPPRAGRDDGPQLPLGLGPRPSSRRPSGGLGFASPRTVHSAQVHPTTGGSVHAISKKTSFAVLLPRRAGACSPGSPLAALAADPAAVTLPLVSRPLRRQPSTARP